MMIAPEKGRPWFEREARCGGRLVYATSLDGMPIYKGIDYGTEQRMMLALRPPDYDDLMVTWKGKPPLSVWSVAIDGESPRRFHRIRDFASWGDAEAWVTE